MTFTEITVTELAIKLTDPDKQYQFVDVREPEELEVVSLPQFINLPLRSYSEWSPEIYNRLDKDTETFVLCHHGMRSAQMCQWLIERGFTQVSNIIGGIDAYSHHVDPSLPRY
ncbi:rhodanese-like domain-containing protein [Chamaesiphon sp. GL140_3_metabinner_50]|uniref:rhodanese-like domain-containing protein n=1 Tax=Chamaesiphon sp. GL140_3_metabinner_50 TaxID=2970812 RepID=UPI0025FB99A7|nr:rhodanese-like domain-containing protein [Chamaesiphon sp. GL140_3_metabinner_50]